MTCVCVSSTEDIDKKIEKRVEEGKRRRRSNPRKESAKPLNGTNVSESRYVERGPSIRPCLGGGGGEAAIRPTCTLLGEGGESGIR